ncbi:MAG: hypothetical protein GY754_29620 [bacterium]|nr:hypothetical protein [bacterium]
MLIKSWRYCAFCKDILLKIDSNLLFDLNIFVPKYQCNHDGSKICLDPALPNKLTYFMLQRCMVSNNVDSEVRR